MGIREGSRLGFWRNLIGAGEKWQILRANPTKGLEDRKSRGRFVRCSDHIMLKTTQSDMLLGLSGDGTPRLVHKDRIFGGAEIWQLQWAHAMPEPTWMATRPYINGSFLLLTAQEKYGSDFKEAESRCFPVDYSMTSLDDKEQPWRMQLNTDTKQADKIEPLSTLSPKVQEQYLLKDILLVLSGVEGTYVRVAAPQDGRLLTNSTVKFAVDVDAGSV